MAGHLLCFIAGTQLCDSNDAQGAEKGKATNGSNEGYCRKMLSAPRWSERKKLDSNYKIPPGSILPKRRRAEQET